MAGKFQEDVMLWVIERGSLISRDHLTFLLPQSTVHALIFSVSSKEIPPTHLAITGIHPSSLSYLRTASER
jgi:hypothetical protein